MKKFKWRSILEFTFEKKKKRLNEWNTFGYLIPKESFHLKIIWIEVSLNNSGIGGGKLFPFNPIENWTNSSNESKINCLKCWDRWKISSIIWTLEYLIYLISCFCSNLKI